MSAAPINNEHELAAYLSRPKRLLLVEDDSGIRELFRRLCEDYNCVVDEAEDADEARLKVGRALYDVLLLDIKLPGMNGPEFYEMLQREDNPIPTVFVTGHMDMEVMNRVNGIGFACFVIKPSHYDGAFAANLMAVLGVKRTKWSGPSRNAPTFSLLGRSPLAA